jgi:hypothetical protein
MLLYQKNELALLGAFFKAGQDSSSRQKVMFLTTTTLYSANALVSEVSADF